MPRPDSASPRGRERLRGALALLAVVLVQVAVSALYWMPDARAAVALTPTWEVAALLVLIAAWPARWADRGVVLALSIPLVLIVLVSLGQGFLRREFARDLVLALDLAYVSALIKMLFDAESHLLFAVYMVGVALLLALAVAGPYFGIRHLRRYAAAHRRRQVAFAAGAVAYLAIGGAIAGVHPPVTAEVASQLSLVWNLEDPLAETARRLEAEAAPTRALALPGGAEGQAALPPRIYLFVVESYGHVLFAGAPHYTRFPGFVARQAEVLAQAGWRARSRFLRAPVFGGGSWMADASLFCGVQIGNPKRYASLLQSDVRCLPKVLKAAGYRTVWAAPSTTRPDARFSRTFAFDATYFHDDFAYAGPRFGWSFVPDQLVIDFVHRKEVAARGDEPLFIAEVLTTSHVPWNAVPPVLAWDQLGDGAIYERVPVRTFDNQMVFGREYEAGYLASIEYSLETIVSHLARLPADDRSLVIVIGDHQPRQPVGDRARDPWWTPVHVLSRDPAAVERFAAFGYEAGLLPARPRGEPPGHEHLMAELLAAYGAKRP